jgi:uncharacterized protein (TIGR02677 family)
LKKGFPSFFAFYAKKSYCIINDRIFLLFLLNNGVMFLPFFGSAIVSLGVSLMSDTNRKISAAKYLTEEADEYRAIMRFFLLQHRAHNHFVESTAVWQYVKDRFIDYPEEKCQYHLDQLHQWGAIRVLPLRTRPKDINDARRRPKTYQIERIALRLEEARLAEEMERAAKLNPSALDDMIRSLEELAQVMDGLSDPVTESDQVKVYNLWHSIYRSFDTYARSADSYMLGLIQNQPKTVDMDQYEEYKNRIRDYLTDYISRLFEQRDHARHLLRSLEKTKTLLADCCAAQSQRELAADALMEDNEVLVSRYREQVDTLLRYFTRHTRAAGRSDVDVLIDQARGFIVEISDHVKRLSAQQRGGSIHEQQLLQLARQFAGIPRNRLEEAEWLAQVAFGATLPLHFKGQAPPPADQPAWEARSAEVPLQAVRRGQRQRIRPDTTRDRSVEEIFQLQAQADDRLRKVRELEALFGPSGILDLSYLHLAAPDLRRQVLDLVRRAEAAGGAAPVGYRDWQVVLDPVPLPTGVIAAPDGFLYRRPYILMLQKGRI